MEERAHIRSKNITYTIILIIIIILGSMFYTKYNFNDFTKSVRERGKTSFSRDSKVKVSKTNSYKIENKEYNDAIFYETVNIKPNTPYKVTCKIKTEAVENENDIVTGGAQICVKDTTECSKSIIGTTDWTEVEFLFNAKNRTKVDIGFRLGGFEENAKGVAWFTDFKIEEGTIDSDNTWNMVCFIVQNLDVDIEKNGKTQNIKLSMSNNDIYDMESNMKRLPSALKTLSNDKMKVEYDVIKLDKPLTSLSYDEKNEYYVSPNDIEPLIKDYVDKKEYDYIYVAVRLGNLNENKEVLVHDWIGLRWNGLLSNRIF